MKRNHLMEKSLVIGIILLFVEICIIPSIAQDVEKSSLPTSDIDWWSMFHHDSSHNGYSSSPAPNVNTLKWHASVDTIEYNSLSVVNGRVYIGSKYGRVYCLDANTGGEIWNFTAGDLVWSTPAVVDERAYVGSFNGILYCLNATTGNKIWGFGTGGPVASSPTVINGKVYFGSYDYNVYCVDALTGHKYWEFTTGAGISSSPAVVDGKVYANSWDSQLYCLNAETGDKLWNYTAYSLESSPTVASGKVYFSAMYNDESLYCLDADTGDKVWSYDTGPILWSSPAIADDKVYVGSNDRNMSCLNANNGSLIWKYRTNGCVMTSPAIADGKIYFGSYDQKVYCLDAETGVKIWDYLTSSLVQTSPAIADGKVYTGSLDGKVYCFGSDSENQPPNPPTITGQTSGKKGKSYPYKLVSTDPEKNNISYYIDWGDGTNTGWIGLYPSGTVVTKSHTWSRSGTYTIKAKAKDVHGNESDWGTLSVKMPFSYNLLSIQFWEWLFERFPHTFPILRHLMRY